MMSTLLAIDVLRGGQELKFGLGCDIGSTRHIRHGESDQALGLTSTLVARLAAPIGVEWQIHE